MDPNEIKKITEQLEFIFLKKIIELLRTDKITVLDSKNYAIDFLRIEPFTDFADVKAKIEVFVKAYPLFIALQDYVMAYHHEEKTKDIVEQMRAHIRANNIDGALQVAKGE